MTLYFGILDGVVIHKQPDPGEGLIEGPDWPCCGTLYDEDTGEYSVPPAAPPPVFEPHLNYGGLARWSGAAPVAILEAIRMAGVTRVTKGRFRVSHETAMPSDQYSVMASVMDPLPRTIRVTARTTTYVEVRITDLAGVAQDPAEAIVKTERVISS